MTKTELNARLTAPLTASKLKKTSLADLRAMVDAQSQPKERKQRMLKPHTYCQPVDTPENVTSLKEGSKKHKLAQALLGGATREELCEATGWKWDVVSSAFSYDMKNSGFGVERRDDQKYYLLMPAGLRRLPVMEKGQSRADALVAACK